MRHLICFFLVLFFSNSIYGQQAGQDVVYLKDGSSYRGIIIEQKPGQHLRLLQLPEKDTLTFSYTKIDRLTKEVVDDKAQPTSTTDNIPAATPERLIQIHGYTGGGDYSFGGLGVTVSQQFYEQWYFGIGAHYIGQTNDRPFVDQQVIALTADVKWRISQSTSGRFSSYLAAAGGYYFPADRKFTWEPLNQEVSTTQTFYFNPSIAFRMDIYKNLGLMLDLGYQLTTAKYINVADDSTVSERQWNNVTIRGTIYF